MKKLLILVIVIVLVMVGFGLLKKISQPIIQPTAKFTLGPGDYNREVPNWPGRPYELYIPSTYNSSRSTPLVLLLHGGGGNAVEGTIGYIGKLTCPKGNLASSQCFKGLADREGFVLVLPNGSANPILPNVKTWNAGGGKNGYTKVSKYAVEQNVDDISYFNSLLDGIERVVNIDPNRIYATGISNGGAMSYRLACELSNRIAAIAPIASGNQFGAVESCNPKRPVPIAHIHGTADEGWPYTGGKSRLADDKNGIMISVPETIEWWVNRNNCDKEPKVENLPEVIQDGTNVIKESYTGCKNNSDIIHYKIIDGGHTWPQGWQYFSESLVGKTSQQLNANEVIWEFFKKHPMQ